MESDCTKISLGEKKYRNKQFADTFLLLFNTEIDVGYFFAYLLLLTLNYVITLSKWRRRVVLQETLTIIFGQNLSSIKRQTHKN